MNTYNEINKKAAELYGEEYPEETIAKDVIKKQANSNTKKIIIILFCIIAIIISSLIIIWVNKKEDTKIEDTGYINTIEQYIDLINAEVVDLKEYKKINAINNESMDNESFEVELWSLKRQFGDDFKVSYKILYTDKINNELYDTLQTTYITDNDLDITDAYEIHIGITVDGSNETHSFICELIAMKINNQWITNELITIDTIRKGTA